MAEITIGDVQLASDGRSLTIRRKDQPNVAIGLDTQGVEQLIEFVTSLVGAEFNRRRTFRVPVGVASVISVVIQAGKKSVSVTPRNISLTGIFVEAPSSEKLTLSHGDVCQVSLDFEGRKCTLGGVVRRCVDNGYGIFFPETMKGEEIEAPSSLVRIVMELQRRWVAAHSKRVP